MGDRGTKPSSSMISRLRRDICRCRLSSRLSSLAPTGPLYLVFTGATPQPRLPSRCTSPTWRCWTTGPAPAGGPGCKLSPSVAKGVAGKPGLFAGGRKLYFRYSSQGVEQDDAVRLWPGLGAGAGGQEPGPANRLSAYHAALCRRAVDSPTWSTLPGLLKKPWWPEISRR